MAEQGTRESKSPQEGVKGLSQIKCFYCGKWGHEKTNCPFGERVCYNCLQSGHESKKCPKTSQQQPAQNPGSNAQAFTLNRRDAHASNTIIQEARKMITPLQQARKEYAEFEEKLKRTIYLDNLSPQVTSSVIKSALSQFGIVVNVEFIPNYTIPYNIPQVALVELESQKHAKNVLEMMTDFPFMMSGMPRPVRACPAKAEMFADRPAPPGRQMKYCWVEPSDPDFETARKLKQLAKQHATENLALIKHQVEEEEKLAKQQQEMLNANYKKHELIESIMQDGTVSRVARRYGIKLADD